MTFKTIISAIQKLSIEERQLLWLQLFSADTIKETKAFERKLKKKKSLVRKTDEAIVNLTTSIRRKRYIK